MAEFKVGDEVTVFRRWGATETRRVARVTKRFVELEGGSQWNHHGGTYPRRGDSYDFSSIEITTPEHRAEIARTRLVSRLRHSMRRTEEALGRGARLVSSDADIEAAIVAIAKLEVMA